MRLKLTLMQCCSTRLQLTCTAAVQFTAVPQSIGAPLRTVTVRDAIADLPAIQNGHDQEEMQYAGSVFLAL